MNDKCTDCEQRYNLEEMMEGKGFLGVPFCLSCKWFDKIDWYKQKKEEN